MSVCQVVEVAASELAPWQGQLLSPRSGSTLWPAQSPAHFGVMFKTGK